MSTSLGLPDNAIAEHCHARTHPPQWSQAPWRSTAAGAAANFALYQSR
jgi:hypothetical protein